MSDTERPIYQLCEWYALCIRPAIGTASHPILPPVPICQECALKHSLVVTLY